MKTSISNRVTFFIAFSFICGTGFGQKSVNYLSVGSQLEEITALLDDSCKKVDRISTEVITDFEMLVRKNAAGETVAKITDWGEVQLNELNSAVRETKIWFSKHHFAPIKLAKAPIKDIAKK
jgi:hypothetical protein